MLVSAGALKVADALLLFKDEEFGLSTKIDRLRTIFLHLLTYLPLYLP